MSFEILFFLFIFLFFALFSPPFVVQWLGNKLFGICKGNNFNFFKRKNSYVIFLKIIIEEEQFDVIFPNYIFRLEVF